MSVPGDSHVLTHLSWCDMDLLGVGNCLQMRCNVNHTVAEATLSQQACAADYMQVVMYTSGVVLKIPGQCSFS